MTISVKGAAAFIATLIALAAMPSLSVSAEENLDEMITRRARQTTAVWGADYLEDPDTFIWQPETLMYIDTTTGREVWILARTPDQQTIYSKEISNNVWSYDGSLMGFWVLREARTTKNPDTHNVGFNRWLVKSNGSYLKAAEGYAHLGIPNIGFGWANTENAYYGLGDGGPEYHAELWDLTKNVVAEDNTVTGQIVLDTKTAPGGDDDKGLPPLKKVVMKDGISYDDNYMLLYGYVTDWGKPVPTASVMRIELNKGLNPVITDYWPVYRGLPEYANHLNIYEGTLHDGGLGHGPKLEYMFTMYNGRVNWRLKTTNGSASDGGPLWEEWNGSSYGNDEVTPMACSENYSGPCPDGPYMAYWNHPSQDRWNTHLLEGAGDQNASGPGTILHMIYPPYTGFDGSFGHLVDDLTTYKNQYDGRHHAYNAWSDYGIFFPWYVEEELVGHATIYGRRVNFKDGTRGPAETLATTHHEYTDNYNGYPRPSLSPDGTKVAYSNHFLNNSGDDFPYINYVVAYYPFPPEISSASTSEGKIRLSWDFSHTSANSRTYTTRGWPDEKVDLPPSPREINAFRVWTSVDGVSFTPIAGTVVYGNRGGSWNETSWSAEHEQPAGTVRYYAVTSIEHSGIESRSPSNVWRVELDSSGTVISSGEHAPYPAEPGGIKHFYAKAPPAPSNLSAVRDANILSHYRLTWAEPPEFYETIRYYNVYYSTTGTPEAVQQNRIASLPRGESSYLDWNADPAKAGYYLVTSVDTQGNEGTVPAPGPPVAR